MPAAWCRSPRVAAVLALSVAVVALHGGLLGALSAAGPRASPAMPVAAAVRALDLVGPHAAVRPTNGAQGDQTTLASPPQAESPSAATTARGRRDTAPGRGHVDRQAHAAPSSGAANAANAASAAMSADTAAARIAAPPATHLPAPPRDDAPMTADPPPVYTTFMPAPATLRYALRRGDAHGEATLSWRPDGATYELALQAMLPEGATLDQRSQGGFDNAGLAPLRLSDRRRGRAAQAVNFQRPQARITFSGPRWEFPLVPGVQDRLSWLVQIVAIVSATPLAAGDEVALQVVGARGASSRWRFRVERDGDLPAGTLHLVREPEHLYDLRLDLWLDPARGHWPVRMRQAQVPGGSALEWVLDDGPAPPGGT